MNNKNVHIKVTTLIHVLIPLAGWLGAWVYGLSTLAGLFNVGVIFKSYYIVSVDERRHGQLSINYRSYGNQN